MKQDTHIIKVIKEPKKPFKTNTARQLWWLMVRKFHGKTVAQFSEAVTVKAPSQPARGKLQGKTEPVSGWLAFFTRCKLIQVVAPK